MAQGKWRFIHRALEDIKNDPTSGVTARVANENDWRVIIGTVKGPEDTPYEGGTFTVKLMLPDDFPIHPPKAMFTHPVYHPNVSQADPDLHGIIPGMYAKGAICLSTIQDGWSPAFSLKTVLLSIQQLLDSPEFGDGLTVDVVRMYREDKNGFFSRAREYSIRYAGAPRELPSKAEKEAARRRLQAQAAQSQSRGGGSGSGGAGGWHPDDIRALENMGFPRNQILFAFDAIGAIPGKKLAPEQFEQIVAMLLG